MNMTNRFVLLPLQIATAAAAVSLAAASYAAEINPAAMSTNADQFTWRDPTDKVATNQTILHGDPNGSGLHIYINKFKPGRFGLPHYDPTRTIATRTTTISSSARRIISSAATAT
jgi:hypothetical protein